MGTHERRQREATRRRETILNAARKLFRQDGYSRTTMPQVAEAAELAPGTLYLYFPSKGALYVELLIEGYDILEDRLRSAGDADLTSRKRCGAMIDAFFGFAREYPEYFDIIFFIIRTEKGGFEGQLPADQVRRVRAREQICKDLVGQTLTMVTPGRSAKLAARIDAIWSMLAGVVLFFGGDENFGAIVAETKRLMLSAVLGGE